MPGIFAQIDPNRGRVFIETFWYDWPSTRSAAVFRIADSRTPADVLADWTVANTGEYPPELVRPNTRGTGFSGWEQQINSGYAFWYDTEIPLDVPVTYWAYDPASGVSASLPSMQLPSSGRFWLRNPQLPADDVQVTNGTSPVRDCVPISGVYFGSMDAEARASLGQNTQIDDSPFGVVAARKRGARSSVLTLATRTFDDRDNLIDMLAPGQPLLLQGPAQYGIPDTYMDVGDFNVARGLSDHRRQWRLASLPFNSALRPVALQGGTRGTRWKDQCSAFSTYTAAATAGITTQTLIAGVYSQQSPGWESWGQAKARFVTWGGMTSSSWQTVLRNPQ